MGFAVITHNGKLLSRNVLFNQNFGFRIIVTDFENVFGVVDDKNADRRTVGYGFDDKRAGNRRALGDEFPGSQFASVSGF